MPLILHEKQSVLLKLKQPARVTAVIPTAQLIEHEGQFLVSVPHRPDECRVLRALGHETPDPMKLYYQWPGRFKPFKAQEETANFLAMHNRAFCLNSMGLGKTVTALWAYDYLRSVGIVKRLLVVCPLSTMERTWADEAFTSFTHLEVKVLYGSAAKRRGLLEQEADVYIVNIDGLKVIKGDLAARPDIDLVVLDECAMYRNPGTDRWKAANEVVNKQTPRRCWGLTGAPTPNDPTDAWAQCRLLVPSNPDVPKYFSRFRDITMIQVSQFKWKPRPTALDDVRKAMQPSIRYALDDVVDLPEQTFTTRDVEMTPEQKKAYKDMLQKLATEFEGGQILAVNEAIKASKLVQIACGTAYGVEEEVSFPAAPRVEVCQELIEESEGKVLVFVPYTGVLNALAEELGKHWVVAKVSGETPKHERDHIFGRFQDNGDELRVIVANPGTMSHGLTLTAATTIIWFAPIHSNDIYEQACARVRRPGQTKTTVIAHIAACDIERRIYERLKNKQKVQGLLLDLIKENVN